jgi:hypothetical protein
VDGVHGKQTNHGQEATQAEWDKGLVAARTNGTQLLTALKGLGVAPPP